MQTKEKDKYTVEEIANELGVKNTYVHYLRRELRFDPEGETKTQARAFLFNAQHFRLMKLAMKMKMASFPYSKIREIVQALEGYDLNQSIIVVKNEDDINEVYAAPTDYTQTMLEIMGDESTKTLHTFKLDDVVVAVAS